MELETACPKFYSLFPLLKSTFFQAVMLFFPISRHSPKPKVVLLGEMKCKILSHNLRTAQLFIFIFKPNLTLLHN